MAMMREAFNEFQINKLGDMASPTNAKGSSSSGAGTIASGVISSLGNIATGFIEASRAKNVYKFNAKMAELQGRMAKISALAEIRNIRKKANSLLSSQKAGYARAGFALEGSPVEVMAESQKEAELDIIYSQINMDYEASGYATQAGIQNLYAKQTKYGAMQNMYKSILNIGTDYIKR